MVYFSDYNFNRFMKLQKKHLYIHKYCVIFCRNVYLHKEIPDTKSILCFLLYPTFSINRSCTLKQENGRSDSLLFLCKLKFSTNTCSSAATFTLKTADSVMKYAAIVTFTGSFYHKLFHLPQAQ